ncbi:MAG: hypothetical protein ACI4GW_03975 [Lachnospiraceae bacterium]
MKKIIMMLVTMSMILSFVACGNSKETGNSETVATDSSAVSEETIAKESEEFGKEFTCLYDKWDLYIATQLSETTFKIENWGRFDAGEDGDPFKLDYDVCVISSTDASTEFKWLDDTHTAFSISMSDENNNYMEGIVSVCFAIETSDSVANFTYLHDKWDLYKATQLSETTFKIENWGRFDAGEGGDPFKHDYDVCVISIADTTTDFKWLDDTHTAFSITLHDKENSYWTEECLVTFVVSSTE